MNPRGWLVHWSMKNWRHLSSLRKRKHISTGLRPIGPAPYSTKMLKKKGYKNKPASVGTPAAKTRPDAPASPRPQYRTTEHTKSNRHQKKETDKHKNTCTAAGRQTHSGQHIPVPHLVGPRNIFRRNPKVLGNNYQKKRKKKNKSQSEQRNALHQPPANKIMQTRYKVA